MPHEANFATMLTLAVFCGTTIRRPWAMLIPLGVRFITDASLGFYSSLVFDYCAYVIAFSIGVGLGKPTYVRGFIGTFASIVLFFLVSNFGVWFMGTTGDDSPRTLGSLLATYELGLPFVRPTVSGNIMAIPVFFGLWHIVGALETPAARVQPNEG